MRGYEIVFESKLKVNYPQTILDKAQGATGAERYLSRLCDRTFLSLWSYPNVFRDQGRTCAARPDAKGDGKELCDLLVVFDNHVIVFSDKNCTFSNNGDIQVDWGRWYKKAIQGAARQIAGAVRWIKSYPDKLYLDNCCTVPLPIDLPAACSLIFHRVVVAHGISKICKEKLGGSGSLVLCPSICDDMHVKTKEHDGTPFQIGQIDKNNGYIHVLDDTSLEIIMQTLDTVSDFVQYLSKKEELINSDRLIFAAGEEDLLAHYLKNTDSHDEHTFFPNTTDAYRAIAIDEGIWCEFEKHPQRLAQIKANKISYLWDSLVEKFIYHLTTGTSAYMSHPDIKYQEKLFRILARENRLRRRLLAEAFIGFIEKTPAGFRGTRIVAPSLPGEPYYLFLLLPRQQGVSDEKYRRTRRALLENYLVILKLHFPDAVHIIGLATETNFSASQSEDFFLMDTSGWTNKDNEEAKTVELDMIQRGLLSPRTRFESAVEEYPSVSAEPVPVTMKGKDRNVLCSCGSGKKVKKCCGKNIQGAI